MNNYKYNWDLKKYFYKSINDEQFNKDLQESIKEIKDFITKYKGNIKKIEKAEELLKFYKDNEQNGKKLNKIFHYLFYLNSLDSQNQEIIKKLMEVENIFTELQKELTFVDEEFKEIGEKKLIEFANSEILKPYKYYILHKAKSLKYILSEKEEKLITEFSNIDSQVENLYNEFHNGLTFKIEIDGEERKLTEEEVRSYRSHKDPEIRRKAYKALREVYNKKEKRIVLSNLYSTFVKNWIFNVKTRGYESPIQVRNISEDMEDNVVNMLLKQVKENYKLFQRYVKLKAKLLKQNLPLPIQDIFAPVVETKSEFTENQAINIHLEVMKNFDKDFYDYSIDLLKNGRVDFFPKEGKRGGAFASYSKGQESFVLLNFTKKLNDIFTLTHEFGHAIHGHLSQIQPDEVYDSPLSLAETASIFNEMLLSKYLLNNKELKKEDKIYLLENKLGDIFATIFRQVQYIDFELEVHNGILNGKQYSHEDYCKIWREKQELMNGNSLKYDVEAEEESSWSMIPHIFHTPFYCYSYAFGNILSFSLYNKYEKEGKDFIENYKKILASGGSIPPKELLSKFGIDITKKDFYENAFEQIGNMLDELEKLT